MQENVLFNLAKSVENYRARINKLESGELVIVPIKDGTRGPLYAEPLVKTDHGRFTKTSRNWHVSFDIDVNSDIQVVGNCLESEVQEIINYIRTPRLFDPDNI